MVYEITLKGRAERTVCAAFDDFMVTTGDGVTVLRGEVADQAALHGAFDRINRLGLVLLSVRADVSD